MMFFGKDNDFEESIKQSVIVEKKIGVLSLSIESLQRKIKEALRKQSLTLQHLRCTEALISITALNRLMGACRDESYILQNILDEIMKN